jgi:hypothetical protein
MDLPGATYLFTLAVVSTTYVGFAALLVGLRQAKGSRLTSYDAYFTLTFIQLGFIVTISGLMPSLVVLYGWPLSIVWRISSVFAAIPVLWFVWRLPGRRRAATGMPVPVIVRTLLTIQAATAVMLLVNGAITLEKAGAIYATAVTVVLVSSGVAYLVALQVIRPEIGSRGD